MTRGPLTCAGPPLDHALDEQGPSELEWHRQLFVVDERLLAGGPGALEVAVNGGEMGAAARAAASAHGRPSDVPRASSSCVSDRARSSWPRAASASIASGRNLTTLGSPRPKAAVASASRSRWEAAAW